jgi:hypothetical protein
VRSDIPSIRHRIRQRVADGLYRMADAIGDLAERLDVEGADEDADGADAADGDAHDKDPIAIALKGCVEIPHPLPKVMRDLNKHYTAMQIEGFVGAWRRTNGKIHIAFAAHDEALLDHLNRHLGQAIAGIYE